MGRKILFITTDMMRWNSLGYTGDPYAQTPNLDQLAAEGIQYHQARNQHPLCMPCRGSLITGQYPRTNGSWNNGIPLVHDAETIADVLHDGDALDHVKAALRQVDRASRVAKRKDRRQEKKVERIDERIDGLERKKKRLEGN